MSPILDPDFKIINVICYHNVNIIIINVRKNLITSGIIIRPLDFSTSALS